MADSNQPVLNTKRDQAQDAADEYFRKNPDALKGPAIDVGTAGDLIHESFPPMGKERRSHEGSQSRSPEKNQ